MSRPLVNLFAISRRSWLTLGIAMIVGGLAAALSLVFMDKTYRAVVLVAVVDPDSSSAGAGVLQSLGGLGALAGLPLRGVNDRRAQYIAFVKGREFTSRFIAKQGLAPFLYPGRWDANRRAWREDGQPPPTEQDLFNRFDRNVRELREDKMSGLIALTIDWSNREQIAEWANALVRQANDELRARALAEAQQSLEFLQRELERTSVLEIRQSIYTLIEAQVKAVMLANVRSDYAFQVLDPAVMPDADKYLRPRPVVVVAMGMLAGAASAVLILMLLDLRRAATVVRRDMSNESIPSDRS